MAAIYWAFTGFIIRLDYVEFGCDIWKNKKLRSLYIFLDSLFRFDLCILCAAHINFSNVIYTLYIFYFIPIYPLLYYIVKTITFQTLACIFYDSGNHCKVLR